MSNRLFVFSLLMLLLAAFQVHTHDYGFAAVSGGIVVVRIADELITAIKKHGGT